jgi:hypothetical protein
MKTATRQANFLLPVDVLDEFRKTVARREQSMFVADALRKELKRLKLESALEDSFGAWLGADHPELKKGSDAYVRNIRRSSRTVRRS